MKFAGTLATAAIMVAAGQPAMAQSRASFNIAAGRVDRSILALGEQANVNIALSDPALGAVRVNAVRGKMNAMSALKKMLRGTPLDYRVLNGNTFLITKGNPSPIQKIKIVKPKITFTEHIAAVAKPDYSNEIIVVTASKRETGLENFAGTATVVNLNEELLGRVDGHGSGLLVAKLPALNSTNLGEGRNKLFIRGIADSSFSGPTQSTVGQYLGDARLNYNAPDPNLDLYDIGRVELLEGPQGTLYGAGSLGGILKLVPNLPKLNKVEGSARAGFSLTDHGRNSNDLAGMFNVPIIANRVAFRVAAYRYQDGGYIDDTGRNLTDVNKGKTIGFRSSLRVDPGDNWIIDLGLVHQDIYSADSQYSEEGSRDLTRNSRIAQPFDNDYLLASLAVAKHWGALKLISATSYVNHKLETRFDATNAGAINPVAFDQNIGIHFLSHETRLSSSRADGSGWFLGFSALNNTERLSRRLGDPDQPNQISGVINKVSELGLFGEWSFVVGHNVTASLGARINHNWQSGQLTANIIGIGSEPKRTATKFIPLAAISWKPRTNLTLYARYHEGFRAGGLSVSRNGNTTQTNRFDPDNISTIEAGFRFGDAANAKLSASASLSYSRWEDIQADLIDSSGFPFTTNIGSGRIFGIAASVIARPLAGLKLEASAMRNISALNMPAQGFLSEEDQNLPNIPRLGGQISATYKHDIDHETAFSLQSSLRYFGKSTLGIGPLLDIEQGNYFDSFFEARLAYRQFGLSLSASNLLNTDANRFSFGNPFSVAGRLQETPLRPRTIRFGIDAAF